MQPDSIRAFMVWIESFWCDDAPPEPVTDPDAVSACPRRVFVRWHNAGSAILGYTTELPGCYQIPVAEAPPALVRRPLTFMSSGVERLRG
jgi:hypothetical protein